MLLSCRGFLKLEEKLKAKTKRKRKYGVIRTVTLNLGKKVQDHKIRFEVRSTWRQQSHGGRSALPIVHLYHLIGCLDIRSAWALSGPYPTAQLRFASLKAIIGGGSSGSGCRSIRFPSILLALGNEYSRVKLSLLRLFQWWRYCSYVPT